MLNYFEIETERLNMKKISMDDMDAIHEYASDPEVVEYVLWSRHLSTDDTYSYIKHALEKFAIGTLITWGIYLKNDKKLIGTIDIEQLHENKRTEVGYVISKKFWGQGYATEALKAVLESLNKYNDINEVIGICFSDNINSKHVMEKCGMSYIKTIENYYKKEGQPYVTGHFYSIKFNKAELYKINKSGG